MAHDVFISYSVKDKPIADAICASIEGDGIRCWVAPRDIAPGEDWPMAVTKAIAESSIMVLVFSSYSNSSPDVSRELFLAANSKLVIIPFKIENVEPEPGKQYYLARTHWLDAINPPTQEQIRALIDCVKALLPARQAPTVVAAQPYTPPPADQTLTSARVPKPSIPATEPAKKTSWTRFLWIPIVVVLLICLLGLGIGIGAFALKNNLSLPAISFLKTNTYTPTEVPPTSTSLPTFTPTINFTAGTGVTGATLYAGPGEYYPQVTFVYGDVTILGQVYSCSWYEVTPANQPNTVGWVSADKLEYPGKCSDVGVVDIPPTPLPLPTFTLIPTATATATKAPAGLPSQPQNSCPLEDSMTIGNRTGSYATFKLVGPGTFYVSLPPDVNTRVPVCEGCYDVYIINGACGDAPGTKAFSLCGGFNGWIYCN